MESFARTAHHGRCAPSAESAAEGTVPFPHRRLLSKLNGYQKTPPKCAATPGFAGFYCVDLPGTWAYTLGAEQYTDPLSKKKQIGFGDYTISLFEAETGIDVPAVPPHLQGRGNDD